MKRMLVDATHPEETRVAIVDGNTLTDFDLERVGRKQFKGNIYLAKVIRIEPSLQAAFVEYGGNRHGFLSFSEIHPDYFRIPMADRPPEEIADDENGDDVSDESEIEVQATIDAEQDDHAPMEHDHDHDHEHHDHEHHHHHDHAEETGALAPAPELMPDDGVVAAAPVVDGAPAIYTPQPASEFAADASHDLGLITDFGNAAVHPVVAPDGLVPAAPVEVMGGEGPLEEAPRRQRRPNYKIQEVVKRRQVMLIQVVKEERGNKGAALTTFLSLAGRYCVLMPNTDHGGGVSRKITSHQDRRRMKEILDQLEIPEGMAVILRTAGMEQEPAEIQRDLEYLLRLWNNIREETLQSTAPALIYEEASLIKRSMRDLYAPDVGEILVAGNKGFSLAQDFMRTIMPDQLEKVRGYEDPVPLFFRYNVEKQIDALYSPTVQLRSGGYIVINPTEALVSIDVNSGRATRERHIEGTALKTNLEAAEEIARQLRLRDLAGLIVIDFIDMEDGRNNAAVERCVKESMRSDRARLQIGRISPFGLMELSRQRMHPSLMEINFEKCPHCVGIGLIRSVDSAAISILRMIEEESIRSGGGEMVLHVPTKVALYILNQKRSALSEIEKRYNLQVLLHSDDALVQPDFRLERPRGGESRGPVAAVSMETVTAAPAAPYVPAENSEFVSSEAQPRDNQSRDGQNREGGRGRRGRYGGGRDRDRGERGDRDRNRNRDGGRDSGRNQGQQQGQPNYAPRPEHSESIGNQVVTEVMPDDNIGNVEGASGYVDPANPAPIGGQQDQQRRGRRRGRRGGRGRRPNGEGAPQGASGDGQQQQPHHNRPPRDPNYQPRHDQRRDNWNQNRHQESPAASNSPSVPVSVHDLDTTPRPVSNSQERSQNPAPYDVVSDSSDRPKGGWWHRLTGGQS